MKRHPAPTVLLMVASLVLPVLLGAACEQSAVREDPATAQEGSRSKGADKPAEAAPTDSVPTDSVADAETQPLATAGPTGKLSLSKAEWKAKLTSEQFHILREAGTERAFSGKYWDHKGDGVYTCAGCGQPLYASTDKFKSGTGWPSFTRAVNPKAIEVRKDRAFGMVRTELLCSRCGGHLGHVFDDGPEPTGERHCINSASLLFDEPAGK